MKALRTIFALAALALVGSALALVQPQGYAGKSLLRAAHSVSFRGSSEGSPAAWTPASIPGLRIWQDAAQITGLNDGDAVSSWADSSGNGLALTQATGTKQPLYKTGIFGSQPAVLFDGVDDELLIASHSFSMTAGTLFAVYKATDSSYGVVKVNNDFAQQWWRYGGDGNGYWGIFYTGRIGGYPAAMPGPNVATYLVDVSTPSQKMVLVNGVSKGTQSVAFETPDRVNMGGIVVAGTPRMTGYIAEWGMYDSALSGANLTALQNYLAAKYGL